MTGFDQIVFCPRCGAKRTIRRQAASTRKKFVPTECHHCSYQWKCAIHTTAPPREETR